jgi:hypothetical protein
VAMENSHLSVTPEICSYLIFCVSQQQSEIELSRLTP